MQKLHEYLLWIYRKIVLNNRERTIQIREGEIYWCSLGENIGDEENGKGESFRRPVLVVKKFNNNICWVVPLITKNKEQSAMLSQLRLIDTKRFDSQMESISREDLQKVKDSLIGILEV